MVFNGFLDDMAIYDFVLSQAEIDEIVANGVGDNTAVVPEPSSFLLLTTGVLCLIACRRRRRRVAGSVAKRMAL